ncbi:MAG: AAA family ATPase, partial [Methanomicrobiales archaeon]|nr:AAA family ATPase [Methanomicrobiales archaeon]
MEDTPDNRRKFVRFIAQEVKKDGKIPHFDRAAIGELIREGRRRSNRKGHLTLKLRDIGGLIRTAGDLARQEGVAVTTAAHVVRAKETARSIEEQISDEYIRRSRDYELTVVDGSRVGRVNGLAVMGTDSGSVLPIMAEVTPAINKDQGSVIATGTFKKRLEPGLQEEESIAEQSIKNVSAIIKKFTGKDIKEMDIHIQFIGTYGAEGDSASISVATAVISAIEGIPVHQDLAMTGSLSVRGDVLPVGGVTYKIEAAAKAGIHTVLIPKANAGDVLIEERYRDKVEIIPVENIEEVLTHALIAEQREGFLTRIRSLAVRSSAKILDTALPKPVV